MSMLIYFTCMKYFINDFYIYKYIEKHRKKNIYFLIIVKLETQMGLVTKSKFQSWVDLLTQSVLVTPFCRARFLINSLHVD